jgi:Ca2+-binding EF-hand superfamily protein
MEILKVDIRHFHLRHHVLDRSQVLVMYLMRYRIYYVMMVNTYLPSIERRHGVKMYFHLHSCLVSIVLFFNRCCEKDNLCPSIPIVFPEASSKFLSRLKVINPRRPFVLLQTNNALFSLHFVPIIAKNKSSKTMTTASPSNDHVSNPLAPKEMKELKRVYDQLCYFADKSHALQRLKAIHAALDEHQQSLASSMRRRGMYDTGSFTDGGGGEGSSLMQTTSFQNDGETEQEQDEKIADLQKEQKELKKKLADIRSRTVQHVRPQDTAAALKALGKRTTKREVQDMMWEVDEKLDGVIDWDEFHLNFERNIRDDSGLEPASFYHMVQFMIYDNDNNGKVSIDETMNMLYARVGREQMETTITKLFGGDDGAPIKEVGHQGGEIDFERYWEVVVREQTKNLDKVVNDKLRKR